MKTCLNSVLIGLFLSAPAFATETIKVPTQVACRLEGDRAYVPNGKDTDVYVCEKQVWTLLYTSAPGDDGQD